MLRINSVLNNAVKESFKSDSFYVNKYKTFEERLEESTKVRNKYPDRVPVICEKNPGSGLEMIDKRKYLVPYDLTSTQFLFIIRKRLKLASEKGIFLFVGNMIAPSTHTMIELYNQHRDRDGFLYMNYTEENVFG
jgi:GABA(A) receptor-associated protein